MIKTALLLAATGCAVLGGCGRSAPPAKGVSADPVVTAALNDPLLTDPDLVLTSNEGAVLAFSDPLENMAPPFDRSDEEVRRVREAVQLAGGIGAPPPLPDGDEPAIGAATPLDAATALPAARPCLSLATREAAWAARMPAAFAIVPRGHVLEAWGSDAGGCRLRAVTFVTPLPVEEVVGFYAARARAAAFTATRRRMGAADVLSGGQRAAGWLVHVQPRTDGLAQVALVTLG